MSSGQSSKSVLGNQLCLMQRAKKSHYQCRSRWPSGLACKTTCASSSWSEGHEFEPQDGWLSQHLLDQVKWVPPNRWGISWGKCRHIICVKPALGLTNPGCTKVSPTKCLRYAMVKGTGMHTWVPAQCTLSWVRKAWYSSITSPRCLYVCLWSGVYDCMVTLHGQYCDVPGSPCLSVSSLPGAKVVCWRPHLAGTRQYILNIMNKLAVSRLARAQQA